MRHILHTTNELIDEGSGGLVVLQPVAEPALPSELAAVQRQRVGYLLLLGAVACNGARYHLDALALRTLSPLAMVGLGSFAGAAGIVISGWWWRWCGWRASGLQLVTPRQIGVVVRQWGWWLVLATLLGTAGGWLYGINTQRFGPELTSFLANLTLVFLVLAGLGQGERLRWVEVPALGAVLGGAFLFSYRGGRVQWLALGIMAAGALCTAGKQLLMKHATGRQHLPCVMAASLLLMGTWAALAGLLRGGWQIGSAAGAAWATAGGLTGSMLGMSLLYAGYQRLGVARGAAMDALRPLVVLVIGLAAGAVWPGPLRWFGALLVLAGSVALPLATRAQARRLTAPPAEFCK